MNIFSSLKVYAGKWSVKSTRKFTSEEISAVDYAEVVPSKYGNSVLFNMVKGGTVYIPLSNTSTASVGDKVDLTKANILTLEKQGESDIIKVEI